MALTSKGDCRRKLAAKVSGKSRDGFCPSKFSFRYYLGSGYYVNTNLSRRLGNGMIKKGEEMSAQTEENIDKDVRELERDIDTLSKVTFMGHLLDKQNEIRNTLDLRTSIVIGFDSALIAFVATGFHEIIFSNPFMIGILGVFIVSLLFAIIALKPPHYQTQKGQHESIFYHHYIESKDMEDYREEIHDTLKDKQKIFDAYITETYNLTKYSNIPRKLYLYLAIRTLIYGIAIVILIYGFWNLFSLLF